jgi:RNA-directed DNA polymerase
VSSDTFKALDDFTWKLIWKWATWTHPDKPKPWIATRYFGRYRKTRNDRWVFGHDGGHLLPISTQGDRGNGQPQVRVTSGT